jgi:hypothetical protein
MTQLGDIEYRAISYDGQIDVWRPLLSYLNLPVSPATPRGFKVARIEFRAKKPDGKATVCDARTYVSGYEIELRCYELAGHVDESGPGDQHFHYDEGENLYWLPGLPKVSRETEV